MKFDISNASTYSEISIESYVAYLVFDQMYKMHPLLDLGCNDKNEVYNPASIASQFIYSHIQVIIFAALAIESEINLLGQIVFGRALFSDAIEKNSTVTKIMLIDDKKGNSAIKCGEEPLNGIKLLFSERDRYVHDKSVRLEQNDNYERIIKKREVRLQTEDAIKVLISFNKYIKQYYSEEIGCDFISTFNMDRIKKWNENLVYIPEDKDLLHGLSFPDRDEYELFLRSRIGYYF
jgi:hypothetical protein